MKAKKSYITYAQIRASIESCGGGVSIRYAVNKSQYDDLLRLEGQTIILDNGIGIIENVRAYLHIHRRLKRNYILENGK